MTPSDGLDSSTQEALAGLRDAPPEAPAPGGSPGGLEARHLRALVALVDNGSMTAAARRLGIAQSTVSETIAALDRLLGTAVVLRQSGARGVELTAAGRALLPHARRALEALEEARLAVVAVSREARESVAVVANESLTTYLLPQALAEIRAIWPQTRFTVTVATCAGVREGVSQGRFDLGLALRAKGETPEDERAQPLAEVRLALFASAAHPLVAKRAEPLDRSELLPFAIFSSDSSGDFHAMLERYFGARGAWKSPGEARFESRFESVGSVEAVKRSVGADHLALGVLPAYAIAEELARGELRALPLRPSLPRLQLEASFGAGKPASPASAELVEALRATLSRRRSARRASQSGPGASR